MKKKNLWQFVILSFFAMIFSLLIFLPKTQHVYAVSSNYSSLYNYYVNYDFIKVDETTKLDTLQYSTYQTYCDFQAELSSLLLGDDAGLTNEEKETLNNIKAQIMETTTYLSNREKAIKTKVVDYMQKSLIFKSEIEGQTNEEILQKVVEIENYKSQNFSSSDMTFVEKSKIALELENGQEDWRDEFDGVDFVDVETMNDLFNKAFSIVNVEYIKASYQDKIAYYDSVFEGLKPIPKTQNKDEKMLKNLKDEIEQYYNLVKADIENAGIDKTAFEAKFNEYFWKLNSRLKQIKSTVSTVIIWVIAGVVIGCGLIYLLGYYIYAKIKRKKSAKDTKEN